MRDEYTHRADQAVEDLLKEKEAELTADQKTYLLDLEQKLQKNPEDIIQHIDEIELEWGLM